ncbi:hypothetical protein GB928_008445 [Shinella curvata]|uniref:Uncharacterized protein n=1 Tax=Shinella curvata TaxID=1817964 RepID=A0ABT8XBU9_9HYPH|nr:hypothetical protein [Shinella curvata]MCJ8054187.1 hypothetical protein [Shinella curvata]MDO6121209.1 hypothetical protein [Shinella curvata]
MAEARLFRRLGLSKSLISGMLVRASKHGTTLEAELLASGALHEDTYYEALAEILHLPFLPRLDPAQVADLPGADSQLVEPSVIRIHHPAHPPITAIVPSADRIETFTERLDLSPMLRTMLAATTPSALRTALWQAGRMRRLRETIDRLFGAMPEASARITLWGRQGFYTGTVLTAPFGACPHKARHRLAAPAHRAQPSLPRLFPHSFPRPFCKAAAPARPGSRHSTDRAAAGLFGFRRALS